MDQRHDALAQMQTHLVKLISTGRLTKGQRIAVHSSSTVCGPRAGAVEVECGLQSSQLLSALDEATVRQLVPWKFNGTPVAYIPPGSRAVRVEAGWPPELAVSDIPFRRLGDHPRGGGTFIVGVNETGRTVTTAFDDSKPTHLIAGHQGSGKALDLRTPIPTIDGWKLMGDLQIGDILFDDQGETTKVLEVHDIQLNHDCYEVEFDNGEVIIADAEHLWTVWTLKARRAESQSKLKRRFRDHHTVDGWKYTRPQRKHLSSTVTTRRMAEKLICPNDPAKNYAIRVARSLGCTEKLLPIDPYVLGAWLGDGTSMSGGITIAEPEIHDEIEKAGYRLTKWKYKYAYGIVGLNHMLGLLNLTSNKHIPQMYLRSSHAQRLALLQGLMDTDGYITKRGNCEIALKNPQLSENLCELLASLGIKASMSIGSAKLYGKDCGIRHRIKFSTTLKVFRLPRKIERLPEKTRPTQDFHYVVDVRKVETRPVRCIRVDSPSQLFLAGHSMVPTHNTYAIRSIVAQTSGAAWGIKSGTRLVLIDGKRGEGLDPVARMPGVVGPLALDPLSGSKALAWTLNQMNERLDDGFTRLTPAQKEAEGRILVIIDEVQEFAKDAAFIALLSQISRQGRAAWVHILVATHHPTVAVLSDAVLKMTLVGRIGLRVMGYKASEVVFSGPTPRADYLQGKGDSYVAMPSGVQRVQWAYFTEGELSRMSGAEPELSDWPDWDGNLNQDRRFTGAEIGAAMAHAESGGGRDTLKRFLAEQGLAAPGSGRAGELLKVGKEAVAKLKELGYNLCQE